MEEFKYMYIMDLSDITINEVELKEEDNNLEPDDILEKYGFDSDYCSWMFTVNRINNINVIES